MSYEIKPNHLNEQIILANMIHDAVFRRRMIFEINDSMFYVWKHKVIFATFESMVKKDLEYNEDTFTVECTGAMKAEEVIPYLRELPKYYDRNVNISYHVETLKRDHVSNTLLTKTIPQLETQLMSGNLNLESIGSEIDKMSQDAKVNVDQSKNIKVGDDLQKSYIELLAERKNREFKAFHFDGLDDFLTCGVEEGQITVLAGLSGSGKTTVVSNMVSRQVHHDVPVLYFPLEEGGMRVMDRMVASVSGIDTMKIKKFIKTMVPEEKIRVMEATTQLKNLPLTIYNGPTINFNTLKILVERHKPKVIVIDLFEKIEEIRGSLKQEVIAAQLDTLQNFVQQNHVHAIITAQIRRDQAKSKNRRPTLESIKNTGKYAEVSDIVIGLHREAYFQPDSHTDDIVELIVLKQRDGPAPFTVGYVFDKRCSRIGEYRPMDLSI